MGVSFDLWHEFSESESNHYDVEHRTLLLLVRTASTMERSTTVQFFPFASVGILHGFARYLARPSVPSPLQGHTQHLPSSSQLRQIHVHDPLLHDAQFVPL